MPPVILIKLTDKYTYVVYLAIFSNLVKAISLTFHFKRFIKKAPKTIFMVGLINVISDHIKLRQLYKQVSKNSFHDRMFNVISNPIKLLQLYKQVSKTVFN
jgi:hypothetical protein